MKHKLNKKRKVKREISLKFSLKGFIADVKAAENYESVQINPLTGKTPKARFSVITAQPKIVDLTELALNSFILNNWQTLTKTGWKIKASMTRLNKLELVMVYVTDNVTKAVNTASLVETGRIYDNVAKVLYEAVNFGNGFTLASELHDKLKLAEKIEG